MKIEEIRKRASEIAAELRDAAEKLASGGDTAEIEVRMEQLQAEADAVKKSLRYNQRAAELEDASMQFRHIDTATVSEGAAHSDALEVPDEQMRAIAEPQYKRAFVDYMRKGERASPDSLRAISVGIDTDGGYLVPPDYIAQIISRRPAPSSVVDLVSQIGTSRDRVQIPRSAYTGQSGDTNGDIYTSSIRMEWTAELEKSPDQKPTFGMHEIPVYEGTVTVPVSRQMAEDSATDIGSYIADEVGSVIRLATEDVIINGDGVGKPKGVLRAPGTANEPPTINVGNPATPQGLMNLVYGLPQQYASNAVAVMSRTGVFATLAAITQNSNLVFDGVFGTSISGVKTETLLGYPIQFSPFMPNAGGGANIIAYGDWAQAYILVRRLGVSLQVQDLPTEKVMYYVARTRFGGDIRNPRALRIGVQS